ncbi:MAG TPA: hypothetical protein VGD74_08380 [Vulgatibacter sp.]
MTDRAYRAYGHQCNTGGPSSRTRTERLSATVLGDSSRRLRLPRRLTVGLLFPQLPEDPVEAVRSLLRRAGYGSVEQARRALAAELPMTRMAAMPWDGAPRFNAMYAEDKKGALVQALILGLCTANLYDPSRPVIWTHASLKRRLELFDLGGFYEA